MRRAPGRSGSSSSCNSKARSASARALSWLEIACRPSIGSAPESASPESAVFIELLGEAMLIVLHPDVSPKDQAAIEARVRELGLTPHAIEGAGRTAIGITGNKGPVDPGHFRELTGVADCIPVTSPYKLVSREVKHEDTVVDVAGVPIGGPELVVMAGPCAVENENQILSAARGVAASGASLLRGGAFKPRTSPYDFQGLKQKGLELLAKARAETGLKIVTEVKDTETLGAVVER